MHQCAPPFSTAATISPRRRFEPPSTSFNGKLRDELLNRELFLSVPEARFVLDEWRLEYNHRRPHSSLNWQNPAAYAAALDNLSAGAFPAASRVASPVGATPLPPTPHAY